MIVTVTPNPSVDRTLEGARVVRGSVVRATSTRLDAGGNGVNVARALIANGVDALAVLPVGGGDGHLLGALLGDTGIPFCAVATAAATRSNITLSEPDGTVTKANLPASRSRRRRSRRSSRRRPPSHRRPRGSSGAGRSRPARRSTSAVDRLVAVVAVVAEVAELADGCEPLVLDLIAPVVVAGDRRGAWVGVCGETASDPAVAGRSSGWAWASCRWCPAPWAW